MRSSYAAKVWRFLGDACVEVHPREVRVCDVHGFDMQLHKQPRASVALSLPHAQHIYFPWKFAATKTFEE